MSMFRIGPYRLDADRKVLILNGEPLRLGTKAVEVLITLVERPGEVVTKDEILGRVWPEGFVEEANLSQNVYMLRRTFQEHLATPAIATVHGRGYRFIAPVETEAATPSRRKVFPWAAGIGAAILTIAGILLLIVTARPTALQHGLSARGNQYFAIAQYYLNQRQLPQSLDYFSRVVKTDPHSPLGHAGMAQAYALMPDYGGASASSAMQNAYAHASEALTLDANSAQAIAVLGFLKNYRAGDPAAGIPDLRRAVALDQSDALAHEWLGESLLEIGKVPQAVTEFESAQRLNPVSPIGQTWLGSAYLMQRRYADAIDHLRRGIDLYPKDEIALERLVLAYDEIGDHRRALATVDAISKVCTCPDHVAAIRAFVLARDPSLRPQAWAELRKALSAPHISNPMDIAFAYIALGDRAHALTWMHRVVFPDPLHAALFALDPRLDPVKGDWRFKVWTHPLASN